MTLVETHQAPGRHDLEVFGQMPEQIDNIAMVLDKLETGVDQLSTLTRGLDRSRLHSSPGEEAWSANDVLAHLRACADVWGKSLAAMISENHPTLRYVSPRTWIRRTHYPGLDFHASLMSFADQRRELLELLRGLRTEDWARGATFTATTRGREGTVLGYAQRIASHEAEHLRQMEDLVK